MAVHAPAVNIKERIREIAAKPYARELVKNEDGTWFARIVEFLGCMTEGDTVTEAHANLDEAMEVWLESHLEDGDPIPEPLTAEHFSGKFVVRVAKTLHRDLSLRAEHEGISLNQYVVTQLAKAVGYN